MKNKFLFWYIAAIIVLIILAFFAYFPKNNLKRSDAAGNSATITTEGEWAAGTKSNTAATAVPGSLTLDSKANYSTTTIPTPTTTLGDVADYSNNPIKVVDSNTIYLAYGDAENHILKFGKSTDKGGTWNFTTVASQPCDGSTIGMHVLNANIIFISYMGAPTNNCPVDTRGILKLAKSTDGGTNWISTVVDDGSPGPDPGHGPGLGFFPPAIYALDANTIFIAYDNEYQHDLRFAKSTDGGNVWSRSPGCGPGAVLPYCTNNTPGHGGESIYAFDANTVIILFAYQEDSLGLAKTTNGGTTWTSYSVDPYGYLPSLAVVNSNIFYGCYRYYQGPNSGRLKLAKTSDGGINWTTSVVDTANTGSGCDIDFIDANTLFISYYDGYNHDLRYATSTDGGTNWSIKTLDAPGDVGTSTRIDVLDIDNIFIAYHDKTNSMTKLAQNNIPISGTHTSAPTQLDGSEGATKNFITWETFTPTYTLQSNTSVKFRLRTSPDASTWTAWSGYQTPASATPLNISAIVDSASGANKYLQVESTLENTDGTHTPSVDSYSVQYHTDVKPNKPVAQTAVTQ